jgi:AraC family ethanolamine operon transcriptional activator
MNLAYAPTHASQQCWQPQSECRTLLTEDAEQHASSLHQWQQNYDQISSGRFAGVLTEAWVDGIQIFEERLSTAIFQRITSRPGTIAFGVTAEQTRKVRWLGRDFGADHVSCIPVGSEAVMSTPPDSVLRAFCVPLDRLDGLISGAAESRREQFELLKSTSVRHAGLAEAMRARIGWALETLTVRPRQLQHVASRHQFMNDIVAMADEYVAAIRADEDTLAHAKARKVVARAREYLMEHLDRPVTVLDLCAHTHTARRTLQYCFEVVVGTSPAAFLKTVRLNGVRRDLIEAAGTQSIGDLAARWGFWHLSQFSLDYKLMFGELPSATAKRVFGRDPAIDVPDTVLRC